MSKIFLGNGPWKKPGYYGVRAGSRWPHFEVETNRYMPFPFQLAYSAAFLEQAGFEVLLVDAIAEDITEDLFLERIRRFAPDLVVLEVSTPSFNGDLRLGGIVKEAVGKSGLLAFCGPHAPMAEPAFLDSHSFVDLVLVGEYELTLKSLAEALRDNRDMSSVPGIVFRDEHGRAVATGKGEIVENVDDFPWPARHFLPMEKYFDNPGSIPEPALQMWASRGCPFRCSYCIWPQLLGGSVYRPRSSAGILDEIEDVFARYNYKSVYFDDDTFNIGKERMLEFCREKKRRGLTFPWAIMARADLMDREILEAMVAVGLKAVKYGVESADPRLLERVEKKMDLDRSIANIRLTKSLGIKVHLTFMFGIPGETWESVERTIRLARDLNPESVQFSIMTPLPGTRIYDELLATGHLTVSDWEKLDGYFSSVVRTAEMSEAELEEAVKYAWRSWGRHKATGGLNRADISFALRQIPRYLRKPKAVWHQVKRVFF